MNAIAHTEESMKTARAAAYRNLVITKSNLVYAQTFYNDALNRSIKTGLEFGLRQASDAQEWAFREWSDAKAIYQQLIN